MPGRGAFGAWEGGRRELLLLLARLAPFALTRPSAGQSGSLLRYPYLQNVSRDSASIIWTSNDDGVGAVRYSTDRSLSRSVSSVVREMTPAETEMGYPYFRHRVRLVGLQEDTLYYYRVMLNGENQTPGDELSFRTAGPGSFSFLAFGDSGWGGPEQYRLAAHMFKEEVALLTHTGDIAYMNGSFEDYHLKHFAVYRELMRRVPFYPSPGNHGYWTRDAWPYLNVFEVPTEGVPAADQGRYYSYNWGPAHFVALDSNRPLVDASRGRGAMLQWLDADLRSADRPWKIVYFHHPPYATGSNQADPNSALVRNYLVPILERHGVQLVLNGHEHSYQRTHPVRSGAQAPANEGIVYIVTGGGGGPLYPVSPSALMAAGGSYHHYLRVRVDGVRIKTEAVGLDGQVIDTGVVERPPALSADPVRNAVPQVAAICPGGLVSIYGAHLAADHVVAQERPLPLSLGGVRVLVNDVPAPLLFASSAQINLLLPFNLSGTVQLRVETDLGATAADIPLAETAPGILAATRPDGSLVSETNPTAAGETLTVYAAGLGPVDAPVDDSQASFTGRPAPCKKEVKAQCAGLTVTPSSAALTPDTPGLYLVVVRIPPEIPSGAQSLQLLVSGALSNVLPLPVA